MQVEILLLLSEQDPAYEAMVESISSESQPPQVAVASDKALDQLF